MSEEKAIFTIGVFGVAVKNNEQGELAILVNVRTDQDKQKQLAGIPANWSGLIVDLPGGCIVTTDKSVKEALLREVREETGCDAEVIGSPVGPFPLINLANPKKPIRDLAIGYPIKLTGEPQATAEASEHRWVTRAELESETIIRFPGILGKDGRMFKMAAGCLKHFEQAS